jgi:ribosomal protein S8
MSIEFSELREIALVNFSLTKSNIRKYINLHFQELNFDSQYDLCSFYVSLIRARHDLVHYFINDALTLSITEKPFVDYFDIQHEDSNKTPDIIFEVNNKYNIIEITVTHDIHLARKNKMEKYNSIINNLKEKYSINFFVVSCNPGCTNIEIELMPLKHLFKKPFDYNGLLNNIELIQNFMMTVKSKINYSVFEEMLRFKYDVPESGGYVEDINLTDNYKKICEDKYPYFKDIKSFIKGNKIDDYKIKIKELIEDKNFFEKTVDIKKYNKPVYTSKKCNN